MSEANRESHHHQRSHRKQKIKKRVVVGVLGFLMTVILLVGITYVILHASGKMTLKKDISPDNINEAMSVRQDETVEVKEGYIGYNGKQYKYNENLITLLCMGIDSESNKKNVPGKNGQADVIFLFLLDEKNKSVNLINIPRDIIAEVQEYDEIGLPYQKVEEQIALQYAYGDGKQFSCKLMMDIVTNIFYGLPINGYAAINLNAIQVLNDQVGGVTVTINEDLTAIDREFTQGSTITLMGDKAFNFVKKRDTSKTGSNMDRIDRQKQYLISFANIALSAMKKDITMPVQMFNSITDYMTTDITVDEVTYMASLVMNASFDKDFMEIVPGTYQQGEVYDEYIVDEEGLYEMILERFYVEAEQ